MSTMVVETKVTRKYLMNKSKDDLATWILLQLEAMDELERFHPRAMKLLRNRKNFIVISDDEPYFAIAYSMIRNRELEKGTWSQQDEQIFRSATKIYRGDE